MIFCGDFVFPGTWEKKIFINLGEEFLSEPKIVNFESTIKEINGKKTTKGIALHSSIESFKALKQLNVICTGHANNHVTDYNYSLKQYKNLFAQNNIQTIGIGRDLFEASKPFIYHPEKLLVHAMGWKAIRCHGPSKRSFGINLYDAESIERQVQTSLKNHPDYKIILFIHWNFEFETIPLPADRKFAHKMVDLGVDAIFGHHPHILNGFEVYKNKPIFYSLGNLFFPQVNYNGYSLRFRDSALSGISVAYNGCFDETKIYYHKQNDNSIWLESVFRLGESDTLNKLSQFSGMSDIEYLKFYKENRFHKNKLLPIYKNYKNKILTNILNSVVLTRQVPIDIISKLRQ